MLNILQIKDVNMISKYTSTLKNMQLLTGYILNLYKYHSDFSNSLNEIKEFNINICGRLSINQFDHYESTMYSKEELHSILDGSLKHILESTVFLFFPYNQPTKNSALIKLIEKFDKPNFVFYTNKIDDFNINNISSYDIIYANYEYEYSLNVLYFVLLQYYFRQLDNLTIDPKYFINDVKSICSNKLKNITDLRTKMIELSILSSNADIKNRVFTILNCSSLYLELKSYDNFNTYRNYLADKNENYDIIYNNFIKHNLIDFYAYDFYITDDCVNHFPIVNLKKYIY